MRHFATISTAVSMLLHAMFGCCWHHAHAHTAAGDHHQAIYVDEARHACGEEGACDEESHGHLGNGQQGHAEHHAAHEQHGTSVSNVDERAGEQAARPLASGLHRHEGCPHSHGDVCCGVDCVFVKSDQGSRSSRLAATAWLALPIDIPIAISPANVDSRLTAGPDAPSAALPLRAHLALQVLLL